MRVSAVSKENFEGAGGKRRSKRGTGLTLGGLTLLVLLAAGVAAGPLSTHSPTQQNLAENLRAPSADHLLGQDKLGRDQLSRLLHGSRVSLYVGLLTVSISL